ncbi:MAG: MarR family winged helix-turn-helix transcriptional regulator [Candidatus Omnitrophota bacterium]
MKNERINKVSAPEDHIGYWLRYVSNNVAHSFSKKLEVSNVTVAEWIILRQMYETVETSPGVVAVNAGLTKGAISKLISRLLKKGLVVRDESTTDRRCQEIKLTSKGERLVPQLAQIADNNDKHFFGNFSELEKDKLVKFLKNIVKTHRLGRSLAIESGK